MSARLDAKAVGQSAKGKWPSILASCGIDSRLLTNKGSACPICQDGQDRFRFDDKDGRGTFFCNSCGSGDGFALLQKVKGWTFGETLREVAALAGTARPIKIRQGRDVEQVKAEMNAIWRGAKPLEEVDATRRWWMRRLGSIPATTELRAVRSLACTGHRDMPAMVAMIRDAEGKPVSLHRTYLTDEGHKAPIESPRRVMDIQLPDGCAVRLSPLAETLGVAEGIETAASCQVMFGVPTWALLTAGNMKKFTPPPGVRKLVIYGDCDASFTGMAAAFELARACWVQRKRRDPELQVEVSIRGLTVDPAVWDTDWNDELVQRRMAGSNSRRLSA